MTNPHYPELFSPIDLGGYTLRNRIIHASIVTKYVVNHAPTEKLLNYYRSRAAGGASAIITEPIAMTGHSRIASRLRAWDDAGGDQLKRVADVVNGEGALLMGQVQDSGRGRHSVGRNDGAVGASALPDDLSWTVPAELSVAEIEDMIADWAKGCARLQSAGFAGVEISAGHGHLFHQFLSPWSNRRQDEYGGDLEGRVRFLSSLVSAIRAECGYPFIIGLKLPADDGVAGSIDLTLAADIAGMMAKQRAEFDSWTWVWGAHARSLYKHLPDAHGERHPYLHHIAALRRVAPEIPTGAIGYITDPNECETALSDGTADLVFLGRPLITDPAFPKKCEEGREADIRYCVSCNTCWRSIIDGAGLACDNNPRVGSADEHDWQPVQVTRTKHIVVVGTGVAALEAAHTAARRGHRVTVVGDHARIGGKTMLHAGLPGGENLSSVYDYQHLMAVRHGVTFMLGRQARAEDVLALAPDHVILATGSRSGQPPWLSDDWATSGLIPSLREMAAALQERTDITEGRAVIVDQDHSEMTYAFAQRLALRFTAVSIVTARERIGHDVSLINRQGIYQRLHDLGVEIICNAEPLNLDALEDAQLQLRNVYSGAVVTIDDVVALTHASSRVPNNELEAPLQQAGVDVIAVGDCRAPRSLLATTKEAYEVAMRI
ncbi:MAG: FAD-dependent oxidoreductase [Luminiphilus sp.]|nr:FAD-dependent oxidoreductase [Luminiphilus sp.]